MSNPYAAPDPDDLVPNGGATPAATPGGMVPPNLQHQAGAFPPPGGYPPTQGGYPAQPGAYPQPGGYAQPGGYSPPGTYPQQFSYPNQGGYVPPRGAQPPSYGPVAPYPPAPYGPYAPYQQPFNDAAKRSNWMGVLSLVLSICGLVMCFFTLISIGGVVFGITGTIAANKGEATNRGLSIAGLVIGGIGMAVGVLYWIWIISAS